MATVVPSLFSGVLFGSALTASSVYSPVIILDQLSLTSTVMLKTFLTASACSAIIVYGARKLGYNLSSRTDSSYGWFGRYDANIVGGLLQGLGMALTGACPGTVLVQVALNTPSATWKLAGSIAGGLAFTLVADKIRRPVKEETVNDHTVMQRAKVSDGSAVLGYEAILIAVLNTVDKLGFSRHGEQLWISPIEGGLLIGVAQVSSVVFSKKTLGVSSAYSELGSIIKNLVSGKGLTGAFGNIVFAAGVMLGAQLASARIPIIANTGPVISPLVAILGGACSIFGARLAGGCTSGHGLSGMATLSVSSFITVAGMFGGGIVFRTLLNRI